MDFDYISLISNMGFPIAVCVYFAARLEGIMKKTQEVIENNTKALAEFCYREVDK